MCVVCVVTNCCRLMFHVSLGGPFFGSTTNHNHQAWWWSEESGKNKIIIDSYNLNQLDHMRCTLSWCFFSRVVTWSRMTHANTYANFQCTCRTISFCLRINLQCGGHTMQCDCCPIRKTNPTSLHFYVNREKRNDYVTRKFAGMVSHRPCLCRFGEQGSCDKSSTHRMNASLSAIAEHNLCFSKWNQTIRFWTRRKRNNQPVFLWVLVLCWFVWTLHLKNLIKSRAHNHSLMDWQLGFVRTCRPAVQRTHIFLFVRSWWMWSGGGFRCLRLIIIIERMKLMKSSFIGMECALCNTACWDDEKKTYWKSLQFSGAMKGPQSLRVATAAVNATTNASTQQFNFVRKQAISMESNVHFSNRRCVAEAGDQANCQHFSKCDVSLLVTFDSHC